MPTFQETIQSAYESGDLSDECTLRQAMMYRNYLSTPSNVSTALNNHPDWPGLDAASDAPGYGNGTGPRFAGLPPGISHSPTDMLRRVSKASFYFRDIDVTDATKAILSDANREAAERVDEFKANVFDPWHLHNRSTLRAWLYLSSDHSTPTKLLQDLGLYHYLTVDNNDSIFRFAFDPVECRKPHWGDADLAFYFFQTEASEPSGLTLSLRTGEPGYPELIHEDVSALVLSDVLLEDVEQRCDLAAPTTIYWDAQITRIEEARK